jgi:cellulose biosynthesis protein BcsQ
MKSVVLSHSKGGVGKTTAAVNLAYLGGQAGHSTLLVDLDAQGAASYILRVDGVVGAKAKKLAAGKRSVTAAIVASDYPNLDVLPASQSLRKLDLLLEGRKAKKDGQDGLARLLERFGREHDLVVVDAPAGIHLEVERIAWPVDLVLVPLVPSPLAVTAFRDFRAFLEKRVPDVTIAAFFSMMDRRKRLHNDTYAAVGAEPGVWDVAVPYASVVERMAARRAPLPSFTHTGAAVESFQRLYGLVAQALAL